MTPSPDLIASVLALPLEARRLLAQQPGPGWWYTQHADEVFLQSESTDGDAPEWLAEIGWAWLPASEVEWMRAATPEGHQWEGASNGPVQDWWVWGENYGADPIAHAPTAPECAVAALRARFGP